MSIDSQTAARLFDLANALAEELDRDPGNLELQRRYERAAQRARFARTILFAGLGRALAVVALLLAGCAAAEPLSRADACAEQAAAWCGEVAPLPVNCDAVYLRRCAARTDADVEVADQDACLDAIHDGVSPWWSDIPTECTATWTAALAYAGD